MGRPCDTTHRQHADQLRPGVVFGKCVRYKEGHRRSQVLALVHVHASDVIWVYDVKIIPEKVPVFIYRALLGSLACFRPEIMHGSARINETDPTRIYLCSSRNTGTVAPFPGMSSVSFWTFECHKAENYDEFQHVSRLERDGTSKAIFNTLL